MVGRTGRGTGCREKAGGGYSWQSPAAPLPIKGKDGVLSRSLIGQLRQVTRNLSGLGIPFEVVALLVAQHMRQNGIPITAENLDKAFA